MIPIIVNGRQKMVAGPMIDYAEIVNMAHPKHDPETIYTVTYYKRGVDVGMLSKGDPAIQVHQGMIFNAHNTSAA